MKFKLYIYLAFSLIILNCDNNINNDNYINDNGCENPDNIIEDYTGTCCSYESLDCNNICYGTMQTDNCNVCGGDDSSCDLTGCNDPNANNYNENSIDNNNCVYNEVDSEWTWVWGDEFNTNILDESKWDFQLGTGSQYGLQGWGNNELQYYTNDNNNISIDSCDNNQNCLIITAINQTFESSDYTSARIKSAGSGIITYGRIDVRAKLPIAQGTWPAIWMLPKDMTYGGWPASGEIDILEHIGCDSGTIHGSIHCNDYNHIDGTQQTGSISNIDIEEFHVYRIDWDENSIKWYIDDILFYEFNNNQSGSDSWPFDQPFYLILNLAIGGTWGGYCGIDYNAFPQTMEIDYVRFYEKIIN